MRHTSTYSDRHRLNGGFILKLRVSPVIVHCLREEANKRGLDPDDLARLLIVQGLHEGTHDG